MARPVGEIDHEIHEAAHRRYQDGLRLLDPDLSDGKRAEIVRRYRASEDVLASLWTEKRAALAEREYGLTSSKPPQPAAERLIRKLMLRRSAAHRA